MIRLTKEDKNIEARVNLPASKSISNRLLIVRHLYGPKLSIANLSAAEDTILLQSLLTVLEQYGKNSGGMLRLDTRNCGTAFRFLTALLSITPGQFLLTGSERMKLRPVGQLVNALRDLGADMEYLEVKDHPPLLIRGRKLEGGQVCINASISSQFLTAMLLIAPKLDNGLSIQLAGAQASRPYVEMTIKLLHQLGVMTETVGSRISIRPKAHLEGSFHVEPDWSAAAYWYTMLSLADQGYVEFPGLHFTGFQGDEVLSSYFHPLGVVSDDLPSGIRIRSTRQTNGPEILDFSTCPDIAMPVILACAIRGADVGFTGLDRLKYKESDRILAMEREFGKLGLFLKRDQKDTWIVEGQLTNTGAIDVEDDDDHRTAMTMACLAAKGFQLHFRNREVVSKSYPGFWNDLLSAGFDFTDRC